MATKKRRKPKAFIKRYGRVLIGGVIIGLIALAGIFAPLITSYDPNKVDMSIAKQKPSYEHPFGTDLYGRDVFSRVIYGTRAPFIVGIAVQAIVICVGTTCGLICGYFRKADNIIMRIMEGIHSLPNLLFVLVLTSVLGDGVGNMIIALCIGGLPGITKNIRGQVLSLKEKEFVECEKAMGSNNFRTLFLHIMPHTTNYLLIRFSTGISNTILSLSSLSYLGVGLSPRIPSWGAIISEGQAYILSDPYLVTYPGLAIAITVFGFCLLGEGLRDILDPRYK